MAPSEPDVKREKEKKSKPEKGKTAKKEIRSVKKSEKKEKPKAAVEVSQTATMAHKILLQPVLSEKSFKMQPDSKYVFKVAIDANKHKIKQAIKEVYGVEPVNVNIIKRQPVNKNRWGRRVGLESAQKRAVVTMPQGTVLNLTE